MTTAETWRNGFAARVANRLTPDRLVVYPVLIIVLFVVVWSVSLRSAVPLPDHLARWTAGRLVLDGDASSLYEPVAQARIQAGVGATRLSWFVSPPYVALLFVPFGALPYPVSAVVWTVLSMLLLAWSVRTVGSVHPRFEALGTPGGMLLAASCQPLLELLGGGQDTALVLAAVVGGARLVACGRYGLGGVVLGASVVKPQLAILILPALLLLKAWRALGGFIGAALAASLAATAFFGWGIWTAWRTTLSSPLYSGDVQQSQSWKNTTIFGLVESLVPDVWPVVATALWASVSLAVVALTLSRWGSLRKQPPGVLLLVSVPLVTILVTPHAMVYELVLLLPATAYLCAGADGTVPRAVTALAYVLLFLAPVLHLLALAVPWLAVLGVPWTVLALIGLWREHLRQVVEGLPILPPEATVKGQ